MENMKEIVDLLEEQIKSVNKELELTLPGEDEKPKLEKLRILTTQLAELKKVDNEHDLKTKQMNFEIQKHQSDVEMKQRELDFEYKKLEEDTAIRNRETDLKEKNEKRNQEIEEMKVKEQKRSNVTNAIIGGVTAATGVAGLAATLHCFKKSMIFEQTGSYTNKTGQQIGNMFNLFRRR